MANHEQRTADIYELVKLIAETLNTEVTRIDGIDSGVNGVGADVIRLTAALADVKSTIEAQKDSTLRLGEAQVEFDGKQEFANEKLLAIIESIGANEEALTAIAQGIVDLETVNVETREAISAKLASTQDEYTQNVANLSEEFFGVTEKLENINYEAEFVEISEIQADTVAKLDGLKELAVEQQQAVENRFDEIVAEMANAISKLDSVSEKAADIKADFKAIIARVGIIETKLSANLPDTDVVDLFVDEDELDTDGEV